MVEYRLSEENPRPCSAPTSVHRSCPGTVNLKLIHSWIAQFHLALVFVVFGIRPSHDSGLLLISSVVFSPFTQPPSKQTPVERIHQDHTMSDEPKPEPADSTHINLKVTDGNSEVYFKIKKVTQLKRLMEAFCKRQGRQPNSLRFLYEGQRVEPEDTPESLDMDEGDVIEAHREQVGGSC